MSELTPTTKTEDTLASKPGSKEESTNSSKLYLSPERTAGNEDEDDITPCYVRGYN